MVLLDVPLEMVNDLHTPAVFTVTFLLLGITTSCAAVGTPNDQFPPVFQLPPDDPVYVLV